MRGRNFVVLSILLASLQTSAFFVVGEQDGFIGRAVVSRPEAQKRNAFSEDKATKGLNKFQHVRQTAQNFELCDSRSALGCTAVFVGQMPDVSVVDFGRDDKAPMGLLISTNARFIADWASAKSIAHIFAKGIHEASERLKPTHHASKLRVNDDDDEFDVLEVVVIVGDRCSDGGCDSGAGYFVFEIPAVSYVDTSAPSREPHCATLRDNILNQTCSSIRNLRSRALCVSAAWATYFACLAG